MPSQQCQNHKTKTSVTKINNSLIYSMIRIKSIQKQWESCCSFVQISKYHNEHNLQCKTVTTLRKAEVCSLSFLNQDRFSVKDLKCSQVKDDIQPTVRKLCHWIIRYRQLNKIVQRSQLPYLFKLSRHTNQSFFIYQLQWFYFSFIYPLKHYFTSFCE